MTTSDSRSAEQLSTGELVSRLSQQLSTLVRDELKLAQAETMAKGKKIGLGAGLFGGAGVVAWFGLGALVAAAIIGLSHAVTAWLAAVIVGVALFAVAGLLGLTGQKEVAAGTPPAPEMAIASVKTDIETVKESAKR